MLLGSRFPNLGHSLGSYWTLTGHSLGTHWTLTGHSLDTHWTLTGLIGHYGRYCCPLLRPRPSKQPLSRPLCLSRSSSDHPWHPKWVHRRPLWLPWPPKPSKAYVLLRFCIHFMKSKFPQQVGPETSKRPQSDTQTTPRDPKGGPWAPFGGPGPTLVLFGVPPGLQRTV